MFDLTVLPDFYLQKYGREKVCEVVGKSVSLVSMWHKRGKFPLDAVQKLLEFDPAPLGEIKPLYTNPEPGKDLCILIPLIGPPQPKTFDTFARLYDKREMGYQRRAFNNLSVARNELAAWALARPFKWLFWMDGDMALPCGDAEWFKSATGLHDLPDSFANVHSIYRLLVHKKTIVSCWYQGRKEGASAQFGGPQIREELRRGPRDALKEVPWCGFGGVLTHRSVFEDIVRTQGDEIRMKPDGIGKKFNYEYGFFNPLNGEVPGDDLPLCHRAIRAGHKIYVDMAVHAGHIGDRAFTFRDA